MTDVRETKPESERLAPLSSEEKRNLLGLGVLAGAWAFVPAGLGFLLLARLGDLSDFYASVTGSQGIAASIALYAVLFGLTAGCGLLPTYAQAILGGWAFGLVGGTIGAMAGILVGAALGHGLSRLVSGDRVESVIRKRRQVVAVRDALVRSGTLRSIGLVALLRLSPNSPFALTNLVLGGSGTRLGVVLAGTAVGMLPRTALAVGIAAAAVADGSRDLVDVVRQRGPVVPIVGVVILVVAVSVIAAVAKAALKRAVPELAADQSEASEPESRDS